MDKNSYRKIVIAVDSFKGSLSSKEIANAAAEGILEVEPECQIIKTPVADGGEGSVETLVEATGGRYITAIVSNPLMQPIKATYGILGDNQTAVIEMASASGLALIPFISENVMHTTTYGTGELIADAISKGCRTFVLGIGGSATNDAGTGMLQALGYRFLDKNGKNVGQGGKTLNHISEIDDKKRLKELDECRFRIATDVNAPFYGPDGAAYIFAPQKGATAANIAELDQGMRHFADLLKERGIDISNIPGAGAGGGIAGGCLAFLNAQLEPGIEMIKDYLHFDELIQGADLIITGEGRIDGQTLTGKTPWGIAQSAIKQNIPVIAITGCLSIDKEILIKAGFQGIYPIHPQGTPLEQAMQPEYTYCNIKQTISGVLKKKNT